MKTRLLALFLSALFAVALFGPAFAQDHGGGEAEGEESHTPASDSPGWSDVQEVTIWSLAGIAAGAVVLGVLYTLKRRVGGFPENPSWVAPITIMPASQLPSDDDDPHGHGHGEGHEAHETHGAATAH